jgi:hypothetical protein
LKLKKGDLSKLINGKGCCILFTGAVFALTSVVEALTPIAASPLYTFVYNATLLIFPGTFYIVSSAIFAVDVILLRFVAAYMNCLMLCLISNNFITYIIFKCQQNVLTLISCSWNYKYKGCVIHKQTVRTTVFDK